jgi:adenylate cyclase
MARRLAAIMFTDMVGYTALAQTDEANAIAVLDSHNRLLRPVFPRFRGREVKTIGDSFLVEFDSALDATRCALEIQRLLHEYNASTPEPQRIRIRIGIHVGDVIETKGDLLGDAVNIASRIQPTAEPEGICITQQVYDQVRNKIDRPMAKLPGREFKNLSIPVSVFKIVQPWEGQPTANRAASPAASRRLAVLPLSNISPDPSDEYFADGMTEELISTVSKVPGLLVISRTSVMQYKKHPKRVEEIGRELKAGTIIEGSVRKAGDRVRIAVQLIDVATDNHLWAETFERKLENVFSIQTEIAEKVATTLRIRLEDEVKGELAKVAVPDPWAHVFYLKGRFHAARMTAEELRIALGYFGEAVRRDPTYALAYAAMSEVYGWIDWAEIDPDFDASAKQEECAKKSLELDDSLPEAHIEGGRSLFRRWDLDGCLKEIQKALEINPSLSVGHIHAATVYTTMGEREKAIDEARKALELDPLSLATMQDAASVHLYCGQPGIGADLFQKVVRQEPGSAFALDNLGLCEVRQGLGAEGLAHIRKAIELSETFDPEQQVDLAYALTKCGREAEARVLVSQLIDYHEKHRRGAAAVAEAYATVGDREMALEWLDIAYQEHSTYLITARTAFGFEELRSDPRFQEFLEKLSPARASASG